jgi:hypothetical protein
MSVESDVFFATNFIAGGAEIEFILFGGGGVDNAFWNISIMPQNPDNWFHELEITRIRTSTRFDGPTSIFYTVKNNTFDPATFVRVAVRTPNRWQGESNMKLLVAHDREGRIFAATEVGSEGATDSPAPREGLSVIELDVPEEFANSEFSEYIHRLKVDVEAGKLRSKR